MLLHNGLTVPMTFRYWMRASLQGTLKRESIKASFLGPVVIHIVHDLRHYSEILLTDLRQVV